MFQYFKKADPDDMSQGALSQRVHYLKNEKGGYSEMCQVAEKIYTQGVEQGIEQGIEQGSADTAKKMALSLHESGVPEELIAKAANVSVEMVRAWLALSIA